MGGGEVRLTVVDTNLKVNRGSDQRMKDTFVKQELEVIVLQIKTVNRLNPLKA